MKISWNNICISTHQNELQKWEALFDNQKHGFSKRFFGPLVANQSVGWKRKEWFAFMRLITIPIFIVQKKPYSNGATTQKQIVKVVHTLKTQLQKQYFSADAERAVSVVGQFSSLRLRSVLKMLLNLTKRKLRLWVGSAATPTVGLEPATTRLIL